MKILRDFNLTKLSAFMINFHSVNVNARHQRYVAFDATKNHPLLYGTSVVLEIKRLSVLKSYILYLTLYIIYFIFSDRLRVLSDQFLKKKRFHLKPDILNEARKSKLLADTVSLRREKEHQMNRVEIPSSITWISISFLVKLRLRTASERRCATRRDSICSTGFELSFRSSAKAFRSSEPEDARIKKGGSI